MPIHYYCYSELMRPLLVPSLFVQVDPIEHFARLQQALAQDPGDLFEEVKQLRSQQSMPGCYSRMDSLSI